MKITIALIGYGNWGKILFKRLSRIYIINFVIRSKDNIKDIFNKVNWAIVSTPDKTHYHILKKLINAKINIFCEKPLTSSHKSSIEIIKLANKRKVKLYVSDIENYKKKKLIIKSKNYIYRSKEKKVRNYDFLRKLFYHDLYLLYPKLKADNIKKIKFHKGSNYMKIFIKEKSKTFYFQYELGKKKSHKINNISLNSKKDYIGIMMKKVFLSRVNFKNNHLSTINTMKILEMTKNARFH